MPRKMSFFMTQAQMRAKTKTVTRRLGWWFLNKGDIVDAVEKGQGLNKGEKQVIICPIRIRSTRPETLSYITESEIDLEGFPDMTRAQFLHMFTRANKCRMATTVNRIEFEFI